jgi:hypothetical protein
MCLLLRVSKTPASIINQQTGYSDKCLRLLVPFLSMHYEKCHSFRFKIQQPLLLFKLQTLRFSHIIFTLVLFIFLCAVKSFGLLPTELHLFSDPCSLSLLKQLRNKPFIRSSVTLCSKLTSRLETAKHWWCWCGSGTFTYHSSRKCYIKASSGFFTCQLHLAYRPHNVSSFRIDSFKRFEAAASNCTRSVFQDGVKFISLIFINILFRIYTLFDQKFCILLQFILFIAWYWQCFL